MFKKLDRLILKAFIGPFVATFFITLLVLVMQFFWLYIDDFVGKGLGIGPIMKFIWYQSAVLVPLALPLAVLLSSLMTFGNLGESFELVAIKSSGISLLRFMRPLLVVSIFISGFAFLFSNYVIPVAWLKSRTMLGDIVYAKPAFDLKEGVFYDKISNFVIKVGKKEANDSIIRDVVIYEQSSPLQDNFIIAKSGVMKVSADKRFLEFYLKDGTRYQEKGDNSYNSSGSEGDYIRLGFKEYKKQFDLSSFAITFSSDSNGNNSEKVMSIRQLNHAIDSIRKDNRRILGQLNSGIYQSQSYQGFMDSTNKIPLAGDSAFRAAKTIDALLPDSARNSAHLRAIGQATSLRSSIATVSQNLKDKERIYRKHNIEWHKKLVLSAACVILFLIGAPLGSIIRKGGLGTPLIAAIIFFMVFYFTTTMGEKLAKENTLSPFAGMWLAAFVLVPIGLFLTYKAMRDSQLFNKESYYRSARAFRAFLQRLGMRRQKQSTNKSI
ncbi:MAG: YjgP/YjgQ family permease [Chitinophagaceae bacterium]|nr:MAG: YjgP/YjgQ family permease [Chitinophagaceae bacterium]